MKWLGFLTDVTKGCVRQEEGILNVAAILEPQFKAVMVLERGLIDNVPK